MGSESLLNLVDTLIEEARRCNQRRLIVIADERDNGISYLRRIIEHIKLEKKITFTWNIDFKVPGEMEELKNTDKYLGTNYEFLAIDVHHSFVPNDLGRLINIVKGGGIIVLLTPPFDKWPKLTNFFHEIVVTPPYTFNDIKNNFVRWVIRKLKEHEGVAIFENGKIIKDGHMECSPSRKEVLIPTDIRFPRGAYEMCMTQDQVKVLQTFERFGKRGVMVITADRGRGKSSILGIAAGLLAGKYRKIGITAPDISNIRELFRFLEITLKMRDIKFKRKRKSIVSKDFRIEYIEPVSLEPKNYDLVIVDEAAGIPAPLLLKYLKGRRVVYSTTIHGYEGTGRSFSVRFMQTLRSRVKNLITIEMEDPIRYDINDPVERWLFDTLLLDSEPPRLNKVEIEKLEYRRYNIEDLLENEEKLREYYGIFVLAHYRNNPNDFGILCDAPNHEIRTLEYDGHVVCSVQLAREGGIENYAEDLYYGETPPGNIVPDVIIKHHRNLDFAKFVGYRIVRIATHPDFMDMGIGSKMLENVKKENVDWIGSSFGATEKLMRFWVKNDFYPIHISPKLNESTGEYSVVIIHPKKREVKRIVEDVRIKFGEKYITSLGEIHREMEPEIAREILTSLPRKRELNLDNVDWKRLIVYAWGPGNYEVTIDVIYKIASQYFFLRKRPKLNNEQEIILIGKVLQHRHWDEVGKVIGKGGTYVVIELREIMRKFIEGRFEDEVLEFQRRFHGEN
jgi:tRNA(Met) cytidine acetyltransferase